jgi:hypothetical protein
VLVAKTLTPGYAGAGSECGTSEVTITWSKRLIEATAGRLSTSISPVTTTSALPRSRRNATS